MDHGKMVSSFYVVLFRLYVAVFQILTELEHSGVGRNKEQSARMLGHLVSNAPRLIRPYMEPILKVQSYKMYHNIYQYSD